MCYTEVKFESNGIKIKKECKRDCEESESINNSGELTKRKSCCGTELCNEESDLSDFGEYRVDMHITIYF